MERQHSWFLGQTREAATEAEQLIGSYGGRISGSEASVPAKNFLFSADTECSLAQLVFNCSIAQVTKVFSMAFLSPLSAKEEGTGPEGCDVVIPAGPKKPRLHPGFWSRRF